MDASVAKFTRLLPISIRKDSSVQGFLSQPTSGSTHATDRGFNSGAFSNNGITASDLFRDPFETTPLNVNVSPCAGGFAEQREVIRVTVTYPSPTVGAMNPHKEISLRLTNDENPMFYYYLRITESDYPLIKSQQGLLVDFYGFPNQLVSLLEKCDPSVSCDEENKGVGNGGPRFNLVMKAGTNSVLDIVESNPFKYLCHLSMQINPGTDTEVKKYLADVTTGLKKECGLWQEKYSHLSSTMEGELTRLKIKLEQRNGELQLLRDEIHTQTNSLSTKHFQDMTVEKEKLLKLQSELASKFENERQELDKRHAQGIMMLENRVSSLEAENRDLIKIKFQNETVLQDNSVKIKNLEDDFKVLQKEITLARKQNEKLDRDYHDKQRMVNSLQNRITVFESDQKDKQIALERQQDYIAQLSEQKKFIEDRTTNLLKEVEKFKSVNNCVSGELMKANEIIKKLQDDIRSLHSKNKLQVQISLEQERVICDRDKQIGQLEDTKTKLGANLTKIEGVSSQIEQELLESKTKVESLEATVKSNENMISWLNKQLNEFQGIGNLAKFRQNLASSGQPISSLFAHNRMSLQESAVSVDNSAVGVNGSMRPGLFSANIGNTLPNGTPSWMHIYQSTSTPLDNDLTSRFEKISATNNNYSLGRSRLDTISEKTGDTNFTDRNNKNTQNGDDENRKPDSETLGNKPRQLGDKSASNTNKPPTWSKPRSGKVSLDVRGAPKSANPLWRK